MIKRSVSERLSQFYTRQKLQPPGGERQPVDLKLLELQQRFCRGSPGLFNGTAAAHSSRVPEHKGPRRSVKRRTLGQAKLLGAVHLRSLRKRLRKLKTANRKLKSTVAGSLRAFQRKLSRCKALTE